MGRTARNTATEILATGAWVKIGDKHYKHHTGVEVHYDHMRWVWIHSNRPNAGWKTLRFAVMEAERSVRTVTA